MSASTREASRTQRIAASLSELIETGVTKAGERLPSIRLAAERHGVSKNTMAEIYDRLVAAGSIESRRGAGYYVCAVTVAPPRRQAAHVAAASDLVTLLREQLDQHCDVRPGDGRPPASWMEGSELGHHLRGRRGTRGGAVEFGYGSSWGYGPLRDRIAAMLQERSIRCGSDQLLLTHGANHALDLIIRAFVEPGDVVFVDDPGYYPLFGKLTLAKARMVGIRRNMDGPDPDDLRAKLTAHRPRWFFTQSLAHNPTGGSIALHVAHDLLTLAGQHGFRLVEDDPFADVLPPILPRLAALDQLHRVIYVGTFAKTLSASLRVGYVAADPVSAAALSDLKLLTSVATSDFTERLVHDLIVDGQYVRHLRRLRGAHPRCDGRRQAEARRDRPGHLRRRSRRLLSLGHAARWGGGGRDLSRGGAAGHLPRAGPRVPTGSDGGLRGPPPQRRPFGPPALPRVPRGRSASVRLPCLRSRTASHSSNSQVSIAARPSPTGLKSNRHRAKRARARSLTRIDADAVSRGGLRRPKPLVYRFRSRGGWLRVR